MKHATTIKAPSTLPRLGTATVAAFARQRPDFDVLYDELRHFDAVAAAWLQDATEDLALAQPTEKLKYAQLALVLYHMLRAESLRTTQR